MKRPPLFLLFVALAFVIHQETHAQIDPPELFCGTDIAPSAISPEIAKPVAPQGSLSIVQAEELLVFLDFDGAIVTGGFVPNPSGNVSTLFNGTRILPAPALTPEQIDVVLEFVRDDFSPFNIRITTDRAEFDAYPAQNKQLCIVTTAASVIGLPSSVGGIAPELPSIGFRQPYNPCFVFSQGFLNVPKAVAETTSHEVGHTMGLGHQHLFDGTCGFIGEYRPPFGTGPISFVPLMGLGFQAGISNWFAQSCLSPYFSVPQNDFDVLSSQVVVRDDDLPDALPTQGPFSLNVVAGILERAGDVDFVPVNFKGLSEVTITSENIDLRVSVYYPGGILIDTFNDPADRNVTVQVSPGMKFLKIEAADNENVSSEFMTGTYRIAY